MKTRKTNLVRTLLSLGSLSAALAAVVLVARPVDTGAFTFIGGTLGTGQRDFRVFNNFSDAQANNNTTADPDFPSALGAVQAIWKGHMEWASEMYMAGDQDPQQNVLGSGGANFDNTYQGTANAFGGSNANIHAEELDPNPGSTLAYMQGPISDGWMIRYLSGWTWQDGPANNGGMDLQGIACHEIGHSLGLGHTNFANATMQPAALGGTGVPNRSINSDDIDGVQALYGIVSATKVRITSLSGSTAIGGTLTIFGENFTTNNNAVWFTKGSNTDGEPQKVNSVSSTAGGTRIDVTIPSGVVDGTVLVKSELSGGASLSNQFPIDIGGPVSNAPSITDVDPGSGAAGGWTEVTITGSGFTGTTSVEFGGVDALDFTVDSNAQITAVAPPGTQGQTVGVTVTDNDGTDTEPNAFTYTANPQPHIASIAPDDGPAVGGTVVTVTGNTLVGVTTVKFGGVNGTNLQVIDGQTVQVTTPQGLGTVGVTATNDTGSFGLPGSFQYVPAGSFTNLGPSGIPGQFGEPVLTGSGDLTSGAGPGYTLSLTGAQPFDLAFFFLAVDPVTPVNGFFGGTFYPLPLLFQTILGVDGSGALTIPTAIPAGMPSGLGLVIQFFFEDTFATNGVSGSNGLKITVP